MNTLTRTTVSVVLASLTLVTFVVPSVEAAQPKALLLSPGGPVGPDYCLPKFGFSSFNIAGVGERVAHVRWGGLASQLGLEPGDIILRMNGIPLSYHGSWNDALYQAMAGGGWVQLTIRDVRTGFVAQREVFVGDGGGPTTYKYYAGGNVGPNTPHVIHHNHGNNTYRTLKQIAKLFDE